MFIFDKILQYSYFVIIRRTNFLPSSCLSALGACVTQTMRLAVTYSASMLSHLSSPTYTASCTSAAVRPRFTPVIVNRVPPVNGPLDGVNDVMRGWRHT